MLTQGAKQIAHICDRHRCEIGRALEKNSEESYLEAVQTVQTHFADCRIRHKGEYARNH